VRIVFANEPCGVRLKLTVRVGEELKLETTKREALRNHSVDVAKDKVILAAVPIKVVAFVVFLIHKGQSYEIGQKGLELTDDSVGLLFVALSVLDQGRCDQNFPLPQ